MLGYSCEELDDISITTIIHPDDREPNETLHNRLRKGEINTYKNIRRLRCKDEHYIWVINEAFASVPFGKNVYSPKEQSSANCVAIRGFYRSDRNDVLALIAKLRSSEYFDFTWNGKDLTEGQIVKTLEAAPAEGNYAAPFELIIPLKNSISLK